MHKEAIEIFKQKAVRTVWNEQRKKVALQGGNVAKVARAEIEAKTGKKVVASQNAKNLLEKKKEK